MIVIARTHVSYFFQQGPLPNLLPPNVLVLPMIYLLVWHRDVLTAPLSIRLLFSITHNSV